MGEEELTGVSNREMADGWVVMNAMFFVRQHGTVQAWFTDLRGYGR